MMNIIFVITYIKHCNFMTSTHFLLIFVHPSFKEFVSNYIMMDFHHKTYLVYFIKSKHTSFFWFQTIPDFLNLRNGT
jgi:transposase